MNRIKSFIAISAFSLLVLGLPAVASAQWRNDPYYGNNGGYNNGNLRSAVQDLKNRARDFERMTNNNGRYNNRGNNGNIENLADQFWKAADRLEDRFGNGRNLNNTYDEAQRVLSIASQIDNELSYNSRGNRRGGWGNTGYGGYGGGYGGSNVQGQWSGLRYDLQIIADAYNYNNRGNRNRNGNYRIGNLPWPF